MKHIAWWSPKIEESSFQLVREVLESNYINDGDVTRQFEKELALLLKVPYVIAVTSGTSALFLALKALNIGPGDTVLVPNVTFIATANAVSMTGAQPILIDVLPDSLTLDPKAVQSLIKSNTKAIVPVHVSGRGGTLNEILKIADQYNIPVIEDAAQAFMSHYKGKYLGTHGIMGCFSFSPNKTITTGQGGAIITHDYSLYIRLKGLKDQGRPIQGTGHDDIHNTIGFNFKLTNVQAAIGLGQLEILSNRLNRMKTIHLLYRDLLSNCDFIKFFDFNIDDGEIPQWTDIRAECMNELYHHMVKNNIHCRKFWHPLNTQKPYLQHNSLFPVSQKLSNELMWLPSSFLLSNDDIKHIAKTLANFYLQSSISS